MLRNTFSVRVLIALFVVAVCLTVASTDFAVAQPPDELREYRFLPHHSTLRVQGGFGGFDIGANIFGTFSFANGYRLDFPNLNSYAEFVDVDAVAINPTDFGPYSFDLDEALNLTGLEGTQLPVAAPFDVFQFRGKEGQGAPMELTAVRIGRWLYLKGSNDAPCCDFFDYKIEAVARQTPFADFTEDEQIDERDLDAWIDGFGYDGRGDADGDNDSDGGDFLAWQRQLGEQMPTMETFATLAALSSQQAALSVVPEPSSWTLVAIVSALAFRRSRQHGREF